MLNKLVQDSDISSITTIGRRPGSVSSPKLTHVNTLSFDETTLTTLPFPEGTLAAFCCLGTTIKNAGSQEAFAAIDRDAVLAFAKWCRRNHVNLFYVVSAVDADPDSKVFYNRIKGEMERELGQIDFQHVFIANPSLLLGNRNEFRPGEFVAVKLAPILKLFLWGPLKKYRPIHAEKVADELYKSFKENSK